MAGEMLAFNLVGNNTTINSRPTSTRSSSDDDSKDFLSSLQEKMDGTRKKDIKVNSRRDDVENKEGKLNSKEVKKLKKLLDQDLNKLDEKDLEEILALLNGLSQQLKGLLKLSKLNNGEIEVKDQNLLQSLNSRLKRSDLNKLQQLWQSNDNLISTTSKNDQSLQQMINKLDKLRDKLFLSKEGLASIENKELNQQDKDNLAQLKQLLQKLNGQVKEDNAASKKGLSYNQEQLTEGNKVSLVDERRKAGIQEGQKEDRLAVKFSKDTADGELLIKEVKQKLDGNKSGFQEFNSKNSNLTSSQQLFNNATVDALQESSSKVNFTNEVSTRSIINQITEQMELQANRNGNRVTIQLEPESLGKLQVKIGLEDGAVTARILTENGQVKELLDGSLARLKDALGQKNIQVEEVEVAVGYEEGEKEQGFNDTGQGFAFNQDGNRRSTSQFSLDTEELAQLEFEEDNIEGSIKIDNVDYRA